MEIYISNLVYICLKELGLNDSVKAIFVFVTLLFSTMCYAAMVLTIQFVTLLMVLNCNS